MQDQFSAVDTTSFMSPETASYSFPVEIAYAGSAVQRDQLPARLFRYKVVKRLFDIAAILLASPVLMPLLLVVACVVRLTSAGPIFYSHRRIRQNGAFFSMWKFRTMCLDSAEVLEEHLASNPEARAEWNRSHKLRDDPRVTAVGLFLRKYSLDELPQIWNVFTGQMSLVGPRPIVAAEIDKYKDTFGLYCRVKPGLTGLWQVSGRSGLTYDERVALDERYVRGWSLSRDVEILMRTLPSVVQRDGAF